MFFNNRYFRIAALVACTGLLIVAGCSDDDDNPVTPSDPVYVWSAFGTGLEGRVYTVAEINGTIVAGGDFSSAGSEQINYIRQWDGTNWVAMGDGLSYPVHDLVKFNNELIACGSFRRTGTLYVNSVARWNGAAWQPLGAGSPVSIFNMTVWNNQLVVAGHSNWPDPEPYIATWNGSAWTDISPPSGISVVGAMCEYDGAVVIAGAEVVGNMQEPRFMSWDGNSWSNLPVSAYILHLCTRNDTLMAGTGGSAAVRYWNGTAWVMMPGNFTNAGSGMEVTSIASHGNQLIYGGWFSDVDAVSASNIVAYEDNTFTPLGLGVSGGENQVNDMVVVGDRIIVGGSFTTAGGDPAANIAEYRPE